MESGRTDLPFPARRNPEPGEPTPVGGFYTQEEIREMVAYAAERQIEVVPEIDMPAHSNSALAAYPHLACPVVKEYIECSPVWEDEIPRSSHVPEMTVSMPFFRM